MMSESNRRSDKETPSRQTESHDAVDQFIDLLAKLVARRHLQQQSHTDEKSMEPRKKCK